MTGTKREDYREQIERLLRLLERASFRMGDYDPVAIEIREVLKEFGHHT